MIVRPSSRVLAIDPAGRVLLFECGEGSRVFWVLPGGGVEEGESHEHAALRELREETGIEISSAHEPCVLEREGVFRHPDFGDRDIAYRERYFALRLRAEAIAALDPAAVERAGYLAHRWWSLDELEATGEEVWPEGLAAVVRNVLETGARD